MNFAFKKEKKKKGLIQFPVVYQTDKHTYFISSSVGQLRFAYSLFLFLKIIKTMETTGGLIMKQLMSQNTATLEMN